MPVPDHDGEQDHRLSRPERSKVIHPPSLLDQQMTEPVIARCEACASVHVASLEHRRQRRVSGGRILAGAASVGDRKADDARGEATR
jgi:hypothetical protein